MLLERYAFDHSSFILDFKRFYDFHEVTFIYFQLQHENANVSYAVSHWVKIYHTCGFQDDNNCKFKERLNIALLPVVCAAYLLDPYYRGMFFLNL
jgi:hypothetical protein